MSEPRRLRFSLATLLLVTTIAAMGITITLLMREVGPLRAEVKFLREERGKLWVQDESKIHVIRIPDYTDEGVNKYRVYLPPGRNYKCVYQANDIPRKEIPSNGVDGELPEIEPGESILMLRFKPDVTHKPGDRGHSGVFQFTCRPSDSTENGHSHSVRVYEQRSNWIVNKDIHRPTLGWQEISQTTEVFDTHSKIVLYRVRGHDGKVLRRHEDGSMAEWTEIDPPDLADGFMLWIEPVK